MKTAYIVVNPSIGIADFAVGPRKVRLNPNPFTNSTVLVFDNPDNEMLRLVIYDVTGKLVREYTDVSTSEVIIKRGNLSPGTYYFQLEGDSGRDAGRFVVE